MATFHTDNRVFIKSSGIGCLHLNQPSTLTPALCPAGERGPEGDCPLGLPTNGGHAHGSIVMPTRSTDARLDRQFQKLLASHQAQDYGSILWFPPETRFLWRATASRLSRPTCLL